MIDVEAMLPDLPVALSVQLTAHPGRTTNDFRSGEFRKAVESVLAEHGDLDIDQIMVGVWQETGVIMRRSVLTNGLHRLCSQGHIRRAGTGEYSLPPRGGVMRDPFGPAKVDA